jgi:kinesin family protein 2/24
VFRRAVKPLLAKAINGGRATFIAFGQTGTGKTHTVHGVEREIADALFHAKVPGNELPTVVVVVFEMRGKKCRDLLAGGSELRLLQDADGEVHVVGAHKRWCASKAELLDAFAAAHALRSTKATERNSQSSRSHAIARLEFVSPSAVGGGSSGGHGGSGGGGDGGGNGGGGEGIRGGVLTLVDLAGSERNEDTLEQRSSDTTHESSLINASLMTLKVPSAT